MSSNVGGGTGPTGLVDPVEMARRGWQLLSAGRVAEAWEACTALLSVAPDSDATQYLSSKTAMQAGNAARALAHADRGLVLADKAALHLQRAQCLLMLGERKAARVAVQSCVARAPDDASILVVAGAVLNNCEDVTGALKVFRQAQVLEPDNPSVLFNLATSLRFLGELEEAETLIDRVIVASPDNHQAVLFRSDLRTQTPSKNHVADLELRIAKGASDWKGQMNLCYALAKEAEDVGAFDQSFRALRQGSSIRRQHLQYNVEADVAVLQDIRNRYDLAACSAGGGCRNTEPIFLVGMPRTGSTLVERILASHSAVTSAGELHDFSSELMKEIGRCLGGVSTDRKDIVAASLEMNFERLGENYVMAARQALDQPTAHFVDKLPFNFLYCGLIHRALPEARIIHVVRNPMDTCYAIYKTLFGQAYPFSYDLDELATYYIAYRKLMAHWAEVLPGRILEVAYEAVVSDTEHQAKRIVAHCNLPWEVRCLEFHTLRAASTTASTVQVRRPVYSSSVDKWRCYERQLASLKARLDDAGYC